MNLKKKPALVIGLVIAFFCLSAAIGLAAPPDNFTAKMVVMGMSMPMAKMGNKTRMENVAMGGLVTISLTDAGKSISLNTKNKTYFEQTIQEKVPSIYGSNVVVEKKKVGSETFDGHPCIKYDAVFYKKDKPQEKFKALLWEAQDLGGLPVRHEIEVPEAKKMGGSGKMLSELKEIKTGAATAAMFEVPQGYKKVNSMNEVMGLGAGPGKIDLKGMKDLMKQMEKMKKE